MGAGNMPLVKQAEKILKITYLEAKIFKSPVIGTEHLLLSILKDEDNVATKSLHAFNIEYEVAKEEFENMISENTGNTDSPRLEAPMSDDDLAHEDGPPRSTDHPIWTHRVIWNRLETRRVVPAQARSISRSLPMRWLERNKNTFQ